jgi:hypothetical protein
MSPHNSPTTEVRFDALQSHPSRCQRLSDARAKDAVRDLEAIVTCLNFDSRRRQRINANHQKALNCDAELEQSPITANMEVEAHVLSSLAERWGTPQKGKKQVRSRGIRVELRQQLW